jgi:hypothetical protein
VKTGLIKSRRIIFTPSVELKDELAATSIIITCYDRNGEEVRRVTSADDGTVEDNETSNPSPNSPNGEGTNTNTGGDNNGGTNQGGDNGGSNTGGGSDPN